jgi:hypothetical protein
LDNLIYLNLNYNLKQKIKFPQGLTLTDFSKDSKFADESILMTTNECTENAATISQNEDFTFDWLGMLKRHFLKLDEALHDFYSKQDSFSKDQENIVFNDNDDPENNSLAQLSFSSLSTSTNSSSSSSSALTFDFKNELICSVKTNFNENLTNATPDTYSNSRESFGEKKDQKFLMVVTMLREKVFGLFLEQRLPFDDMLENARCLVANEVTSFEGHDASKEKVLNSTHEILSKHTRDYIRFIQNLPGFVDYIDVKDLIALAQDNLCLVFALKVTKLFIDNEFYITENGVQLSRKWMNSLLGTNIANSVFQFHSNFNKLDLLDQELALLIPILITSPCEKINYFFTYFSRVRSKILP